MNSFYRHHLESVVEVSLESSKTRSLLKDFKPVFSKLKSMVFRSDPKSSQLGDAGSHVDITLCDGVINPKSLASAL